MVERRPGLTLLSHLILVLGVIARLRFKKPTAN